MWSNTLYVCIPLPSILGEITRSNKNQATNTAIRVRQHLHSSHSSSLYRIAAGVQSSCDTIEHSLNNILLFVTALIPKALASLMTSLLLELSKPENVRL